jgi:hypothetical protein
MTGRRSTGWMRGVTLARWASGVVRSAWNALGEQDRADIEHHRRRSFGRTPLDERPQGPPPDLERVLAAIPKQASK